MASNMKGSGLLQEVIRLSAAGRGVHISVHDTSGVIFNHPELRLLPENMVHSRNFCDVAKSSPQGMKACIRCKALTVKKAAALKKPFVGMCIHGLTEIVKPVYFEDKLMCVIYIGNMVLDSTLSNARKKIKRISRFTEVEEGKLLESLNTTMLISKEQLDELSDIAEVIGKLILLVCQNSYGSVFKSLSPVAVNTRHWIIESIVNYVYVYYARDIKLIDLASLYFIHPNYLSRLFKKEMGMNFTDFLLSVRLEAAKRILANTDQSNIFVAMNTGFSGASHFNNVFKKHTGCTPKQYRKIYGEKLSS